MHIQRRKHFTDDAIEAEKKEIPIEPHDMKFGKFLINLTRRHYLSQSL